MIYIHKVNQREGIAKYKWAHEDFEPSAAKVCGRNAEQDFVSE